MNRAFTPTTGTAPLGIALFTALVGAFALLGWALDITILKSILSGWATVKPNTAIGFILCGAALALLRNETRPRWADRAGKVCAVAVALLGAVTLAQYLLGINIGIDELLFRDVDTLLTSHPGRMAPVTALNFIFCGAALLLLDVSSRRGHRPSQFIILLPMATSFLAVLGYIFASSSLYQVAGFRSVALPTALAFLFFGLGLLLVRAAGWMAVFTNHGTRGLLARRLIPAAIVGPVLIGWVRLAGQGMGLYGTEFGVAVVALSSTFVAVGMILWTAESLHQADLQRTQVEAQLRDIEWLLSKPTQPEPQLPILGQPYGDLTVLNTSGEIMRAVGQPLLHDIVKDYLDLLDTSAAVYEKNGDYALGIFTSGWCRFMDERSRALCGTVDNVQALNGGKWICHESCWSDHSKPSIETGTAVDSDCMGGLRIYAVPIRVGDEVIGSINFGYSDPPSDPVQLQELAAKYQVSVEELQARRRGYRTRPPFIIELAKRRLRVSARLIGEIVSRRRAEEESGRLNRELEERVAARTAELEASNRELAAFSYSVSHDLRAPLRHITGFAHILVEDHADSLSPAVHDYVVKMQHGAQRMGNLIDDLLTFSRWERSAIHREITAMRNLVEEVIAELEPDTNGRKVEWELQELPFLDCDPRMMRVVLVNLLSNALKFTRLQPVARITVGQKMVGDGVTAIFVRDNGVGFNMKYHDKLFGVFQRLHRSEDFEGTGIGLATVQRLVQKHGGQVWAEAELGQGACFYFTVGAEVTGPANLLTAEAV